MDVADNVLTTDNTLYETRDDTTPINADVVVPPGAASPSSSTHRTTVSKYNLRGPPLTNNVNAQSFSPWEAGALADGQYDNSASEDAALTLTDGGNAQDINIHQTQVFSGTPCLDSQYMSINATNWPDTQATETQPLTFEGGYPANDIVVSDVPRPGRRGRPQCDRCRAMKGGKRKYCQPFGADALICLPCVQDGLATQCSGLKWPTKQLMTPEEVAEHLRSKAFSQWQGPSFLNNPNGDRTPFDSSFGVFTSRSVSSSEHIQAHDTIPTAPFQPAATSILSTPAEIPRNSRKRQRHPQDYGSPNNIPNAIYAQISGLFQTLCPGASPDILDRATRAGIDSALTVLRDSTSPTRDDDSYDFLPLHDRNSAIGPPVLEGFLRAPPNIRRRVLPSISPLGDNSLFQSHGPANAADSDDTRSYHESYDSQNYTDSQYRDEDGSGSYVDLAENGFVKHQDVSGR